MTRRVGEESFLVGAIVIGLAAVASDFEGRPWNGAKGKSELGRHVGKALNCPTSAERVLFCQPWA